MVIRRNYFKYSFLWLRLQFGVLCSILLLSLAFHSTCSAATVVLQWDPNTESDLAGYRVYYKADATTLPFNGTGAYEGASPVEVYKQTTATISGLITGHTYYFAVTAYNQSGTESSYSNIVRVLLPSYSGSSLAGDTNGDGIVNALDALLASQFAAGNQQPTPDELLRGDVAPVVNGNSEPNGIIDTGDAVVILSIMMGKIKL